MPDVIGTLFHKEIPYGGVKGDKGDTGATPNVSATASVDSSTGTPSVNVVKTGTAENPSFEFAFSNLKGEKGDPGSGSSVSWGEIDGDIADQTDLMDELDNKTDNSVVGTVEVNATASKAYAVGEHFIRDGAFCTAIAAIAQGAAFTLNTNYTVGTIAEALVNNSSGEINTGSVGSYYEETIGRIKWNGNEWALKKRTYWIGALPQGTSANPAQVEVSAGSGITRILSMSGSAVGTEFMLPIPWYSYFANDQTSPHNFLTTFYKKSTNTIIVRVSADRRDFYATLDVIFI